MVYAATLSEPQRVMRWWLILEEFGPNIKHIAGVDNTIADFRVSYSGLPMLDFFERIYNGIPFVNSFPLFPPTISFEL